MDDNTLHQPVPTHLGSIEPHAPLLKVSQEGQLLYKIITIENLLQSILDSYLHFNRVDKYKDFSGADTHDGEQLPKDRKVSATVGFLCPGI